MLRQASRGGEPYAAVTVSHIGDPNMAADVLDAALALALWVVTGSLVLAVAGGLGPDPIRRLCVGLSLVAIAVVALAQRRRVCVALQRRPWLVVPLGAFLLADAAVDGLVKGPYVAAGLTAIGIGVVAARARTVWLCAALLATGYTIGVFVDHTPSQLARDGQLDGVIGAFLGYPLAATLWLSLRRCFTSFSAISSRRWRQCAVARRRRHRRLGGRCEASCRRSRRAPPEPP